MIPVMELMDLGWRRSSAVHCCAQAVVQVDLGSISKPDQDDVFWFGFLSRLEEWLAHGWWLVGYARETAMVWSGLEEVLVEGGVSMVSEEL